MAEQVNCLGNISKYLRKISKGSKDGKDDPSSSWYLTSDAEKDKDRFGPQYATWPSEKLHSTIHDLITAAGITDCSIVSSIKDKIESELDDAIPFDDQEHFDFCIVCPEIDFPHAKAIKEKVSSQFGLVGQVLWESVSLGADIGDAFEDILRRSTKIVFYVSENFNEYDFSCHLARNYLMEQGQSGSERNVIPLMKNYETEVPESLKLIDRLVLTNDLQFQFRFPTIFTEDVRKKKEQRKIIFDQETDNKRKEFLSNLVQEKVQNLCFQPVVNST